MVAGAKVEGKMRTNKKINEIINIALLTLLVPENYAGVRSTQLQTCSKCLFNRRVRASYLLASPNGVVIHNGQAEPLCHSLTKIIAEDSGL